MVTTSQIHHSKYLCAQNGKGIVFLGSRISTELGIVSLFTRVFDQSTRFHVANTLDELDANKVNIVLSQLSYSELTSDIEECCGKSAFILHPHTLAKLLYEKKVDADVLFDVIDVEVVRYIREYKSLLTNTDFNNYLQGLIELGGLDYGAAQTRILIGQRSTTKPNDIPGLLRELLDKLTFIGIYEYMELSLNRLLIGIGAIDELSCIGESCLTQSRYPDKYRADVNIEKELDKVCHLDMTLWKIGKLNAIRSIETMNRQLAEYDYLLRKELSGEFDVYSSLLKVK